MNAIETAKFAVACLACRAVLARTLTDLHELNHQQKKSDHAQGVRTVRRA